MHSKGHERFRTVLPTRREVLAATILGTASIALGCGSREETPSTPTGEAWRRDAEDTLRRAANWLWSEQRQNGAFPSSTYGLLRDGQSLTPFALLALLQVEPHVRAVEAERAGQALIHMIRMTTEQGALGLANPSLDYPCYATSMMLVCLGLLRPDGWQEAAAQSAMWLRGQQFRRAAGWDGNPAQGGWGLGDRVPRTPPDAGHVDLSMTRSVLEGLRAISLAEDDPLFGEAAEFVARCQQGDGSFVYSPVQPELNKGSDGGYGSATADGMLAWIALGRSGDDPALAAAHDWLVRHHRVDRNPGVAGGPMAAFAEAMRGYYRAGAAECFMLAGGPPGWRPQLCTAIAAEQREDGSFANESPLQKEDDPVIATGFAIRALAAALRSERSTT